jgi:hypothetical protein
MKKNGYSESTIEATGKRLKNLRCEVVPKKKIIFILSVLKKKLKFDL